MNQLDQNRLEAVTSLVGKKIVKVEYSEQSYTVVALPDVETELTGTLAAPTEKDFSTPALSVTTDNADQTHPTSQVTVDGKEVETAKTGVAESDKAGTKTTKAAAKSAAKSEPVRAGKFAGALRITAEDGTVVDI